MTDNQIAATSAPDTTRHPFTYDNAKDIWPTDIRDAFEIAFCVRGLTTQLEQYIFSLRVDAAVKDKARRSLHDLWVAARAATNAIDDLDDALRIKGA